MLDKWWKQLLYVIGGPVARVMLGPLGSGVKSIINNSKGVDLGAAATSLANKYTGADLTGAQQAENAFNANEAEKAREFNAWEAEKARQFEMEMSNTSIQRQVADMQAAGINPVLAAGAGASTPNGNAASGPAASAGNNNNGMSMSELMSIITMPLELEKIKADIDNTKANTNKQNQETSNLGVEYERLKVQVDGSKLDNKQKEIVLKYADRMEEAKLRVQNATEQELITQSHMMDKQIEKMDYEELEIFVHCCDMQEHIVWLQKQENLTDAQINELAAMTYKLNREASLINLNITNFDDITVVGTHAVSGHGPLGLGGSESTPITLADKKARARELQEEKEKNKDKPDKGRDYRGEAKDYGKTGLVD